MTPWFSGPRPPWRVRAICGGVGLVGGGFRQIYREFLEQAASRVARVAELQLLGRMLESARSWQGLVSPMKRCPNGRLRRRERSSLPSPG